VEKRAKQLEGLGIDETDISDLTVSVRQKHDPLSVIVAGVDGAQSSTASIVSATTTKQAAPQSTVASPVQPMAGDKDKKGVVSCSSCMNDIVCVICRKYGVKVTKLSDFEHLYSPRVVAKKYKLINNRRYT